MPHNRRPRPGSKFFLPKYEYQTVVNFCLSYNGLKQRLNAIGGAPAIRYDGMPHGNSTGDPTANDAMLAMKLTNKIRMIEETTRECTGDSLYPPMLEFITNEAMTYDQICTRYDVPIGRRQFLTLRRKVYWEIAQVM